jgi:hypothetical protein
MFPGIAKLLLIKRFPMCSIIYIDYIGIALSENMCKGEQTFMKKYLQYYTETVFDKSFQEIVFIGNSCSFTTGHQEKYYQHCKTY